LRWWTELGRKFKGTSYCQMIREANEERDWSGQRRTKIHMSFEDVVYTDETTVQMVMHRRTCCYKKDRSRETSPNPNTQWKYMFGQESATVVAPLYIHLKERWMLPFSFLFWRNHCYHSSEMYILMGIDLSKTMIPSITQNMPGNFMLNKALTGGPLLLNCQVSSQ